MKNFPKVQCKDPWFICLYICESSNFDDLHICIYLSSISLFQLDNLWIQPTIIIKNLIYLNMRRLSGTTLTRAKITRV